MTFWGPCYETQNNHKICSYSLILFVDFISQGFGQQTQSSSETTANKPNQDTAEQAASAGSLIKAGDELAKSRQYDKAAEAFRKAIALQPKSAIAHQHLGIALLNLGKASDALAETTLAIQIDPNSAPVYIDYGQVNQAMRRYQEAIQAYNEAVRLKPDSLNAYIRLGQIYDATLRYDEAVKAYEFAPFR